MAPTIPVGLRILPTTSVLSIISRILNNGVRGWIHHLAVHAEYRHKGIATMLMRSAEQGLVAQGCPKVNLQVRATNTAVISFYRPLGYDVEERISLGKQLGGA